VGPPISDPSLRAQVWWGVDGEGVKQGTIVSLGDEQLDLSACLR